jgi:hypothetical protein
MKIALALTFIAFLNCLTAQTILDVPIEGQIEGKTISQLLDFIETQHDIRFYFKKNSFSNTPLSIEPSSSRKLGDLLTTILEKQGLSYYVYDDYAVIIAPKSDLKSEISTQYLKRKEELTATDFTNTVVVGDKNTMSKLDKVKLTGKVLDGSNDKSTIGAILSIEEEKLNISTDNDGVFNFEIPVGVHNIEIKLAGFVTLYQRVKVYGDGSVIFKIYPKNIDLQEVVIRDAAKRNIENATAGVTELSIKQIKQLPSLMGEADVLKSLLTLPGVSNVGEGSTGFNVRGGNIDQNLILQDGAFILNPSHVLGLFSSFNPDAVKKVTLYKGHIPAQFGGRTSSVLDIKLKEGNLEHWSGFGSVGPISTKALFEGPLVKGKSSILIGGRATYSDWVLRLVNDINLKKSKASFYDANLKLTQKIKENGTLNLSFYRSFDKFRYSDQFGYGWTTSTGTLSWNQIYSNTFSSNVSFVYGDTENNFTYNDLLTEGYLTNGLKYGKGKINFIAQPFTKHTFNFGAESNIYFSKPETFEQKANNAINLTEKFEKSKGQETSFYVNDDVEITEWLSASLGVRQSLYRSFGDAVVYKYKDGLPRQAINIIDSTFYGKGQTIKTYQGFEPRASLALILNKETSIKLSYNRLFQYIHLISNTAASTPVDIWQLSNTFISPQKADNFSLGYFKNFKDNEWESSVEIYYKTLENLVEYKDFASLLRNGHIETEFITSKGRAYGAELFLKRNKGKLTGYMSYAFNRSLRQAQGKFDDETINNGDWFPSNFDKPHNVNLVLNWQIRKTTALGVNFTYNSGRPVTAPVSNFYFGNIGFLNYSSRNAYRIPDYHRMDVSYTFTRGAVRTQRFKSSLTLSIYNLYFRRNAFSVFFRKDLTRLNTAYRLAILGTALPAITYNFQF